MMWLVSAYLEVDIPSLYYFLLSLMVWIIYTSDHLMDARQTTHEASTPRHRFHQEYFRLLLTADLMGLLVFILLIPTNAPLPLLYGGMVLTGLVLLYFISLIWARKTSFRYVLKELFIASVYTAGVSLLPVYYAWPPPDKGVYFFVFRIFFIALANLLLFSLIEQKHDMSDKHPSALRWFGFKTISKWIQLLLWVNLSIGFSRLFFAEEEQFIYILTLSAMDISLLWLYYKRESLSKNEWYRVIGDGVFLLPFLIWVYEKIQ
jgi:hypothetical protein